jgi:hypothetical protein
MVDTADLIIDDEGIQLSSEYYAYERVNGNIEKVLKQNKITISHCEFVKIIKIYNAKQHARHTGSELFFNVATNEESLTVDPKFKVGDKVNCFDIFSEETILCIVGKVTFIPKNEIKYSYFLYRLKCTDGSFDTMEKYLTHA